MGELDGKVALVTGAGGERGIGRAIAMRLAQMGADVAVNDVAENPYPHHNPRWRGIPQVVRDIEALGRRSLGIVADVSASADVDRMFHQLLERFRRIDILVANAGSRPGPDRKPVVELTEEAWDEVQNVNLKGTFLCSRAAARQMIRQGQGGRIIILSSTAGKRGVARYAAYCTSKFGLVGFTQALALELAPHRINVNAICPGLTDTERVTFMAAALAPEGVSKEDYHAQMLRAAASSAPLGRVATPADIAQVAAFLASPASDYVTGLSIPVSGGSVM
jgi:NAD(P)-dependent dehydrogenase (short-subunit alcohol dehydrogenase family)